MGDDGRRVYKICGAAEWGRALLKGIYEGSLDDQRDGFIHLSTREQVKGTLAKHFAGRSDLLLIGLKPQAIGEALRWEPSRGGELFPHLYAPLPTELAVSVDPLLPDPSGHRLPPQWEEA